MTSILLQQQFQFAVAALLYFHSTPCSSAASAFSHQPLLSDPIHADYNDCTRESGVSRRRILSSAARYSLISTLPLHYDIWKPPTSNAVANSVNQVLLPPTHPISDEILSTLVYERILGQGTYKTVYLVAGRDANDADPIQATTVRRYSYALAVERLKSKSDSKDALRGVRIAQSLQSTIQDEDDRHLFEEIIDWWIQSNNVAEFNPGEAVFPSLPKPTDKSQKAPSKFLGSKWMLSFKPVYEMDLKRFAQRSPDLYLVGDTLADKNSQTVPCLAGISLDGDGAIRLALDICRAGRIMHSAGLVHRDVKPKNIMLRDGRPVIIDFGFAFQGDPQGPEGRICIVQQGAVKGEVRYVLAEDVAKFRGCQEGDTFAMGKALYETIFCTASGRQPSLKQAITEAEAQAQNDKFRSILEGDNAGEASCFRMSVATRDCLLFVIKGLCRHDQPYSFAEAEDYLNAFHVSSF